jgi:hypothetical protein
MQMSRRERDRLKPLYGVVQGERQQKEAARLLEITTRQVRSLVRRLEATIRLDRDRRVLSLFSKLAEPCIVSELPAGVKVGHYEDDGLKFDEKDRHGHPLTFPVAAKTQMKLYFPPWPAGPRSRSLLGPPISASAPPIAALPTPTSSVA